MDVPARTEGTMSESITQDRQPASVAPPDDSAQRDESVPLQVHLTADRMAVLVTCSLPDPEMPWAPLLEGQPPVPPRDGWLEWSRDYFAAGFRMDPRTGSVDYWDRLEDRVVHKGDLLLRVHPPAEGKPGLDLLGRQVKVEPPQKVVARCGPQVTQEDGPDGGIVFRATADGRLRWADNVIAVDAVFTIRGSVRLETGHISHPRAVMIMGDIQNGAHVTAEGDMVIKGMVEPSQVDVGGSLTVQGGIVGAEGFSATVAGTVHARYVLDADIVAGDDVVVTNEITQSRIATRGGVFIPKGRILGSEIRAYRGIDAGQAGGRGDCHTLLVSGEDPRLEKELAGPREQYARLQRHLRRIQFGVEQAMNRGRPLTERERTRAREVL
jgi:uncharacterized protein (DUF342 family)